MLTQAATMAKTRAGSKAPGHRQTAWTHAETPGRGRRRKN